MGTVEAPLVAVPLAWMKGPDVVVAVTKGAPVTVVPVPVGVAMVPVQAMPCGQQPTTLLRSAEQMAVRGQHWLGALLHW